MRRGRRRKCIEYRKLQEVSDVLPFQTPVPHADDEHAEQKNGEDVQALSVMTDMSNKSFTSSMIRYFTGLSSLVKLMSVFNFIVPFIPDNSHLALPQF